MSRFSNLMVALVCGAFAVSFHAAAGEKLKPHAPVGCRGGQSLVLDGVKIVGKVAVNAHGNCSVVIRNSHIEGSVAAVNAHGNSDVRIEKSVLRSPRLALELHGNADVHLKNTRVEGPMRRYGNAELDDQGGNHYQSKAPAAGPKKPAPDAKPPKAPGAKRKPHAPVRCDRGQTQKLSGVRIDTEQTAIDVQGGCTLVISDSEIRAGHTGVRVRGGGTVTLLRCNIVGQDAALDLSGGATVYAKSTKLQGKIKKSGGSVLVQN